MVHADIYPCYDIFLLDILPIEEAVKLDRWGARQVLVPHR